MKGTCPEVELSLGISNYDGGLIPCGLEGALRMDDVFCTHTAWNFCGRVWWNGEQFVEEVRSYGNVVGTKYADTLETLVRCVNSEYGWVWWNGEQFVEEVRSYGDVVGTKYADTLETLVRCVNSEYGWD